MFSNRDHDTKAMNNQQDNNQTCKPLLDKSCKEYPVSKLGCCHLPVLHGKTYENAIHKHSESQISVILPEC